MTLTGRFGLAPDGSCELGDERNDLIAAQLTRTCPSGPLSWQEITKEHSVTV